MINPLRQFFSVTLVFSLLSANGLLFTPLLNANRQGGRESASMQNCCCCCNSGGGMASTCCCASHHAGSSDRTTCSVSSAPCTAPLAALSPNILDQWIDPGFGLNRVIVNARGERFPNGHESILFGITKSLFHPPQSFPFLFS